MIATVVAWAVILVLGVAGLVLVFDALTRIATLGRLPPDFDTREMRESHQRRAADIDELIDQARNSARLWAGREA